MDNKPDSKHIFNCIHNKVLLSNRSKNRMGILLLLILLISAGVLNHAIRIYAANQQNLQEGIAENIIRFHVIANSDSDKDQQLKYQVKDALVQALYPYLKDAKDIEEAQNIITEKLPLIHEVAKGVIEDRGYSYPVRAALSDCYFPMKVYGDYTFPPGTYEALQVRIGDASGKNWWCVMFPPLCFVDETYSIVHEDSGEKLKYLLTEEEFDALNNNKIPVKIRFKLFDAIKKLFD